MTLTINGKTYEAGELVAYVEKIEKENTELKADNDARKFAMTMSEKVEKQLREENTNLKDVIEGYKKIVKWCDKCELEKKISILLSCKNCPENKGGLICQKEYEDKYLAQKIEFIKELQKENAELKEINEGYCRSRDRLISIGFPNFKDCKEYAEHLIKAKEIIKDLLGSENTSCEEEMFFEIRQKAEQFLNSEVEK